MGTKTLHVSRLHTALTAPTFGWGALMQLAVEQKLSCLVTDTLDRTGLLRLAPARLARFLQRAQRANQHTTQIQRRHAGRIASAARQVDLTIAACKGIAVESALYGGTGAREFSDLDILVAPEDTRAIELLLVGLGYQPHRPCSATSSAQGAQRIRRASFVWSVPTGDTLLPNVVVDVTCIWPHGAARGPDFLREALQRARRQPLPGLPGTSLPVLSPPDQIALVDDLTTAARAVGRQPKPILAGDRHRLLAQGNRSGRAGGMT
ncbi:MAG: nucleotidyltransferase family protein [Streptomycetaceae bacterium]|nr:nucleotidyltransferase family protein [Streptomycetaceae bacterium]